MMKTILISLLAVTVLSVNAFGGQPQILRAEIKIESDAKGGTSSSLVKQRMPKFIDDAPSARRQVATVFWIAPKEGAPEGTTLLFEYKQTASKAVRALHIQYPFRVIGERRATFVICEDALREGGPISSWRARLVYRGRLLAQKKSDNWR